jgi:hypothetical protein
VARTVIGNRTFGLKRQAEKERPGCEPGLFLSSAGLEGVAIESGGKIQHVTLS